MLYNRSLQQAATVIRQGGVVAYPTEGCYGLGCDPGCGSAVNRILQLKHRSWRQGLILIAAHWDQVRCYVDTNYREAVERARSTWPGPFTWLLPARSLVSRRVRGEHEKIAVRVTAHPLASALCRAAGTALISTSANPHGLMPARNDLQVRQMFPTGIDYVLSGALGDLSKPTEIRDAVTEQLIRPN